MMCRFSRWIACVICLSSGASAYASSILQQCREQHAGDIAVANCLSLQHEESEVALAGIEESLGNLLGTTYRDQSIGGTLADFWNRSEGSTQTRQAPAATGRQVIAIIDGVATAVDESVLTDDDPGPDTLPPDTSLKPDPLIDFDAELGHFRVYRDNRCNWQARLFEPGETAWREIACRVELNRQRIDELRAFLNRRLAQKDQGFAVRGFLRPVATGLNFQPCGSSQQWPVSADAELSLAERLQSVAGDADQPVFAELSGSRLRTGSGLGLAATRVLQLRAAAAGDCELDTSASTLTVSQSLPVDRQVAATAETLPEGDLSEPAADSSSGLPAGDESSATAANVAPAINPAPADTVPAPDSSSERTPARITGPGTLANAADDLMYAYFQGWAAACRIGVNENCRAFSDAEPTRDNTWQLQVNPLGSGYEIVLLPRSQDVRIGRDVGIFVDRKPVDDRRLSPAETRLDLTRGVVLKRGEEAASLLRELRRGTSLLVRWTDYSNVQTDVNFTLWGLSRALQFKPDP